MKRRAFIALVLLTLGGEAISRTTAPALRFVDLTDEFDAFWERSQSQPGPERAAAFRAAFAALLPGFFDAARAQVDPARYDAHIAGGLADYPRQRGAIREVSRRFAGLFAPARRRFEAALGPVHADPPIYLINSLGEMDGGTRSLPGGTTLIFGADMIARHHSGHDIAPLFHHELFHLYHFRAFSNCGAIWCSLWIEGLATHAAKSLNPGATDAELLLEIPEPIRPAIEAYRAEAVCAVLARLDATGRADAAALFGFSRMNARLPPRFGYYVGYLAAAELGRTRSLRRLARMRSDEVRPLLEAALRRLAPCPPHRAVPIFTKAR